MQTRKIDHKALENWSSPIPESRWRGFRTEFPGVEAFQSLDKFEKASLSELQHSLEEHEVKALSRLLERGRKDEIDIFLRTHGANPISDPGGQIDVPVGVAKADVVDLSQKPSFQANQGILNGEVVHVLFQAGEASRFNKGPLFDLNPLEVGRELASELKLSDEIEGIDKLSKDLDPKIRSFITEGPLGPKQAMLIRAGIRRIIQDEVNEGRLAESAAYDRYKQALANQKLLFFIGRRGGVNASHDKALRETYKFYGFNPKNVVTIEQELVHGLTVDESGVVSLLADDEATDAAGHLYAFLQSTRPGGFTTYTESGKPIKPMELDALAYLGQVGGKYLSIIRINDMDRHSTEIVNARAFHYALEKFKDGYINIIEGVSNPGGQKGGTGTTFGDPEVHVLTETHENTYPLLSRMMEEAMKTYREKNAGRHPAYNAMRQWCDLFKTRTVLREFAARIVFVSRQKKINDNVVSYVGVDMPMGDLSLFIKHFKSRMFQFADNKGEELLIHDMKKKENMSVALRTIKNQLKDFYILEATKELIKNEKIPFKKGNTIKQIYGAPTPEFD